MHALGICGRVGVHAFGVSASPCQSAVPWLLSVCLVSVCRQRARTTAAKGSRVEAGPALALIIRFNSRQRGFLARTSMKK